MFERVALDCSDPTANPDAIRAVTRAIVNFDADGAGGAVARATKRTIGRKTTPM